ncbi:MAG: amidohydrolase family protein [Bacteroidia bacterium]
MKKILIAILLFSIMAKAQVPTPGKLPIKPVVLMGGTLHIGNGEIYTDAGLGFVNGKIVSLDSLLKKINYRDYELVDAKGKHVYPGLIAPNTTIGLNEIDAVRSTRDYNEVGLNNANIRSIIAYNTDSKVTPTVRSNGILLAQITPSGGSISGNSSIVQLDAWNWEDAAVKTDDALHINWPRMSVQRGWWAEPGDIEKLQNEKEILALDEIFSNAKTYCNSQPVVLNLKLEAFRDVFSGKKKVFIHADGAREMISAVQFMQKYGIIPVIVGGDESFLITKFLRENKVAVVLIRTHNLPSLPEDDVDMPYKLPKILHDSGVLYCIADVGAWQQRNLPFQAGTSVAFGITPEQALMAITKNTSEILGIDKNYGTLEVGKSATLIISDGDILDMKTSKVTRAWIDGRPVDLNNTQKELDKKFRTKYFGE